MRLVDRLRLNWLRLTQTNCIHIATVHFRHTEWVDIQLEYLRDNLPANYKVWTYLDEVSDRDFIEHKRKFFFCGKSGIVTPSSEGHAEKLNKLSAMITCYAKQADILIFLDGDAFPVQPLHHFLVSKLEQYKLIAVRRDENGGDKFPHPSFCATTVGFWQKLGGDWSVAENPTSEGKIVSDTGGKLLHTLQAKGHNWYPLLRSNQHAYHPVYFGVYDTLIYHQGGAFTSRQGTRVLLHKRGSEQFDELKATGRRIMGEAKRDKRFYLNL